MLSSSIMDPWVRGSVPLTYGSRFGSNSCFFLQWLTRWSFFAYYFFKVHLHQSSKIKKGKKEVTKLVEIKVFKNTFFSCFWKDLDPYK
jgi:hypothetical protein